MHALLFLALVPSAPAPAEKEKEVPKELKALQGVWKVTAIDQNGRPAPAGFGPVTDRPPLVIVGNEYTFLSNQVGTIKADPEKKEVDLSVTEGRTRGQVFPALFEVSGDTLKLAVPSSTRGAPGAARTIERPKELKSEVGSRVTLYTFERDTKATKEQAAAKLKEQKERIVAQLGPGAFGPGNAAAANEALLKQIIERLDRIEKRLDEMEKKQAKPEEKKK
jgi:uncharacterized protein (TIGR03067 family)